MGVFKKNGFYWIDYYSDGQRHRRKVSPQKNVAVLALKDVQVKISKGEYLGIYEEKKVFFKDFAEKTYIPYMKANVSPTTFYRCEGIIRTRLIPCFGSSYVFKVTRKDIEDYKTERAGEVAPGTVNREFSRLRHMFKCAVDWGYTKTNPCKGIKELKEPPGRTRYLTPEEIERLLAECGPETLRENRYNAGRSLSELLNVYLRPIVEISIHTGMRRSELLRLTWKDIDFKGRMIYLEVTKNGQRRVIPMNDTVHGILRGLPRYLHEDLIFPSINGNMLSMAFKRARERAGIEDFRYHDQRHTFASHLTMGGTSLRAVQELLGHKDIRMTLRYSHLSPGHLQDAVTTLDKTLKLNSDGHYLGTGENEAQDCDR
jgi:integrase